MKSTRFDKTFATWAEHGSREMDGAAATPQCASFTRLSAIAGGENATPPEATHIETCRRCGALLAKLRVSLHGKQIISLDQSDIVVDGVSPVTLAHARTVSVFDSDSGRLVAKARIDRDHGTDTPEAVSHTPTNRAHLHTREKFADEIVQEMTNRPTRYRALLE